MSTTESLQAVKPSISASSTSPIEPAVVKKQENPADHDVPKTDFAPSTGVPCVPLSPDDAALLERYLSEGIDLSIHQLARVTQRSMADLAMWLVLPHISACIDAFLHARRLMQTHRDMEFRHQALDHMAVVLDCAQTMLEKRRAAAAMLRAVDNARPSPRRHPRSGPTKRNLDSARPRKRLSTRPCPILKSIIHKTGEFAPKLPDTPAPSESQLSPRGGDVGVLADRGGSSLSTLDSALSTSARSLIPSPNPLDFPTRAAFIAALSGTTGAIPRCQPPPHRHDPTVPGNPPLYI